MSDERLYPVDLFVLQPGDGRPSDPNVAAVEASWGDGQMWTVIEGPAALVSHVKSHCGEQNYIRSLRIGGHGTTNSFRLGNTVVTINNVESIGAEIKEIIPYFKNGKSIVILDHCDVGKGEVLLKKLSEVLGGVPVVGPRGDQTNTNTNSDGAPLYETTSTICNTRTCIISVVRDDKPELMLSFLSYWEAISGVSVLEK